MKMNDELKAFEMPVVEILNFNNEDVITASNGLNVDENGGGDEYNWGDIVPPSVG